MVTAVAIQVIRKNFAKVTGQREVGRACPSARRRTPRPQLGALNNIGENLVFLRRFSGDTEQIAQTDDKGARVSRSVWSAWSLLPLSDVWRGSKAGASSTHSIRFARFGSGYAGLGTDAPYPPDRFMPHLKHNAHPYVAAEK